MQLGLQVFWPGVPVVGDRLNGLPFMFALVFPARINLGGADHITTWDEQAAPRPLRLAYRWAVVSM